MNLKTKYDEIDAVSQSALKTFMRSPLHYKLEYIDKVKKEPTRAMILGSALHCLILESDKFSRDYFVLPENLDKRTKEAKALLESDEVKSKTILSYDEYVNLTEIRDAVFNNKKINETGLLANCEKEKEIFFEMSLDDDRVLCKSKLDAVNFEKNYIVDIKTTDDAKPEFFKWSIKNYGYDIQAAFYMNAFYSIKNIFPDFYLIAVEKSAPFAISIVKITSNDVVSSFNKINTALKELVRCKRENDWYDYSLSIVEYSSLFIS